MEICRQEAKKILKKKNQIRNCDRKQFTAEKWHGDCFLFIYISMKEWFSAFCITDLFWDTKRGDLIYEK